MYRGRPKAVIRIDRGSNVVHSPTKSIDRASKKTPGTLHNPSTIYNRSAPRTMSLPYICQACSRKLSRIRHPDTSQWARATFVSLSEGPKRKAEQRPRDSLLALGNIEGASKWRYAENGLERKKRTTHQPTAKDPGDRLESLFAESIKPPASPTKLSPNPPSSIIPYQNAEILKKKLADSSCPAEDSWQFFLEHFGPEAWRNDAINRTSSPSYLYIRDGAYSGRALLNRIIQAKSEDPLSTKLPTFTEVLSVYSQLGILHGQDWADMMFSLIGGLLKCQETPSKDLVLEETIVSDLIGSWNVVFRRLGKSQYPVANEGASSFDWSHAPLISAKDANQVYKKRGVQGFFAPLVPGLPFHQLRDIPVIAVASFALLVQEHIAQKTVVQEAARLVSSLGQVVGLLSAEMRPTPQASGLATAPVEEFVKRTWNETRELAAQLYSLPAARKSSPTYQSSVQPRSTFQHKRLQDAFARRDIHQVDRIWADVLNFPVKKEPTTGDEQDSKTDPRGSLSVGICNQFILIYMALRRPNRAIDVWNLMVSKGLSPNMSTWDCMMTGCKTSKDAKALEGIWAKMQASKVQPDIVCWTTRISGLVECNQFDRAMHALDEMGRLWLAAARRQHSNKTAEELQSVDDVPGAIKPTIATVNAAIDGLLKKQKQDDAHRVLEWAGKFGIRPDIITYNTLLRSMIRYGRTTEAMAILQQMQDSGLKPDVATFTTVLEETFRYPEHTPEEQDKIITSIFSEMEAAGIKANLHTYGKIIYCLLECNTGDLTVVNSVLERMSREGLQPSPYISTMLVEHYFSREPPDLDSVRFLIERARMEPSSVDHIFWDRVIEGYSHVGDTTSAVRILGKVNSGSSRISWTTLQKLLSSLVQNQEWDVARTLVRNAKIDSGGPLPEHARGKKDQHRFWRLAAELGLLDA
jgi:pentatricopeptide repeat protein